jgi:Na+/proline symporter
VIVAAMAAPLVEKNVIDIVMTIAGTLLGGLMAVFLLGMFAPRTNSPGALIGLAVGAASLIFVIRATEIPSWWYGAFTIFPTFVVGVLASRFFSPPSPAALVGTIWAGRRPADSEN